MPPEAAAAATTADNNTATGTGGGAAGPWYQGKVTDAELIGHIQTKGWDKDPVEAAVAAIAAHRSAEKLIGAPANQIIRLPANMNDPEAMKSVYERLGAPKDAKEYDFAAVKFANGDAIEDGFADAIRTVAARRGLSKDAAADVASTVVKFLDGVEAAEKAEKDAYYQAENTKLAASWGANAEANAYVAKNAMKAIGQAAGMDEKAMVAALDALEGVAGKANVMQMFLAIGQKIGEHHFVSGDRPASNGVMTREQAVARRAELMADREWVGRYNRNGKGSAEWRQMMDLNMLIAGGDDRDRARFA